MILLDTQLLHPIEKSKEVEQAEDTSNETDNLHRKGETKDN
jgi:hypothetical protein